MYHPTTNSLRKQSSSLDAFPGLQLPTPATRHEITSDLELAKLHANFKEKESRFQELLKLKHIRQQQQQSLDAPSTIPLSSTSWEEDLLHAQSDLLVARFALDTATSVKTVCPCCSLMHKYCVCGNIPDTLKMQQHLANIGSVFVYTHFKELSHQRSSNTGKWVILAGAKLVAFGQQTQEEAMAEYILSRPRGSVIVLYPSKGALTVEQFLDRMMKRDAFHKSMNDKVGTLGNNAQDSSSQVKPEPDLFPTLGYNMHQLRQARGLLPQDESHENAPVLPMELTVIILDATWGLARSLNRRLDRLCNLNPADGDYEDHAENEHNDEHENNPEKFEKEGKQENMNASDSDNYQPENDRQILTRVTLTRAFRTDVGALRRVFGNVSNLRPKESIQTQAEKNPNFKFDKTDLAISHRTSHGESIDQVGMKSGKAGRIDIAGLSRELVRAAATSPILGDTNHIVHEQPLNPILSELSSHTFEEGSMKSETVKEESQKTFEGQCQTQENCASKSPSSQFGTTDEFSLMDVNEETGAKKVSTLHAFCVLIEELLRLSRSSVRLGLDLPLQLSSSTESSSLTPSLTKTQLNALEFVRAMFFILESTADSYHIQLNCRKSELISDDFRERLQKKQILLNSKVPTSKRQIRKQYWAGLNEEQREAIKQNAPPREQKPKMSKSKV